jgi:hypothetical protein
VRPAADGRSPVGAGPHRRSTHWPVQPWTGFGSAPCGDCDTPHGSRASALYARLWPPISQAGGCEVIRVPPRAPEQKPDARKSAAMFPVRDASCVSQSIER